MKAAQAKKPVRDNIRDTFTPPRVGVLSWAIAAVFMGTMGLASYKFGTATFTSSDAAGRLAGLTLPPASEVGTTASIRPYQRDGSPPAVEIMRLPDPASGQQTSLEQSQIAVLQEQIIGLRRRISALSEQNEGYSRRLAALETAPGAPMEQTGTLELAPPLKTANAAFLDGSGTADLADASQVKRPMAPLPKPLQVASADRQLRQPEASPAAETFSERRPPSRMINLHAGENRAQFSPPDISQAPVKIVQLPPASTDGPVVTGSIPDASAILGDPNFDSTPAATMDRPKVIVPSEGAGTLRGGGATILKRSDFGAIVGHYSSLAEAASAWASFREQNEERMQDLRPLIKSRPEQNGVSLLVGPFGNAADAAAACYYLLDVTDLCQPALYAGAPMVAASDFPKTAF